MGERDGGSREEGDERGHALTGACEAHVQTFRVGCACEARGLHACEARGLYARTERGRQQFRALMRTLVATATDYQSADM